MDNQIICKSYQVLRKASYGHNMETMDTIFSYIFIVSEKFDRNGSSMVTMVYHSASPSASIWGAEVNGYIKANGVNEAAVGCLGSVLNSSHLRRRALQGLGPEKLFPNSQESGADEWRCGRCDGVILGKWLNMIKQMSQG